MKRPLILAAIAAFTISARSQSGPPAGAVPDTPNCQGEYVTVASFVGTELIPGWASDAQRKWLEKTIEKGQNKFCLTRSLEKARYVAIWATSRSKDSFTLNLPETTSTTNSSASGTIGRDQIYISGTSTTTEYKEHEYEINWKFGHVMVIEWAGTKYIPVRTVSKRGKTVFADPEKGALEQALKDLNLITSK
jgi:hypothetical protein